jgi:hypothetical protein
VCQFQLHYRFVLYDVKANAETRTAQVLWEPEEDISGWNEFLVTSKDGQCVLYLLLSMWHAPPRKYVCVVSIHGTYYSQQTLVGHFWNCG